MDFVKFPINQSIIGTLLRNGDERELCMSKIYYTKIVKTVPYVPSKPMMYGSYFESQFLGKSARGDVVKDLPRKKLTKAMLAENEVRKEEGKPLLQGEKYLDHLRVDDQVIRARALAEHHRMIIMDANVQVKLFARWDKDPSVMLSGELDIFPTTILMDGQLEAAIIDLKLTGDLHNTYGEYCYGVPEYLDVIQAKMYHYLVRNLNKELNPDIDDIVTESVQSLISQNRIKFLLWIFNYKGEVLEDKFIKVEWDALKENELHESIRKTIAILNMAEKQEWPTNSKYELCKNCPIVDCPDKLKIQTI